jgi:hypothetical protein
MPESYGDEGFQGYEVEEPYGDDGGYTEQQLDMAEQLGVVDEYGDIDYDRLNFILENADQHVRGVTAAAQAASDHAQEQVWGDNLTKADRLEQENVILRHEDGVMEAFYALCEAAGAEPTQEAFDAFLADPRAVQAGVESMNVFQKAHLEKQIEGPGRDFWMGGNTGGGWVNQT